MNTNWLLERMSKLEKAILLLLWVVSITLIAYLAVNDAPGQAPPELVSRVGTNVYGKGSVSPTNAPTNSDTPLVILTEQQQAIASEPRKIPAWIKTNGNVLVLEWQARGDRAYNIIQSTNLTQWQNMVSTPPIETRKQPGYEPFVGIRQQALSRDGQMRFWQVQEWYNGPHGDLIVTGITPVFTNAP